jgi:hypothetical protein
MFQVEPSVPAHWLKGSLLDLKRFGDGSYRATLLGEEAKPELANFIDFDSSFAAQQFTSAWYSRESTGGIHG